MPGRSNKKRSPSGIKFKDEERRKCSKLVVPEMHKLSGLIAEFKEKIHTDTSTTDLFTMCHLQLKLSKELVFEACSMLGFIDLVPDLEELAHDAPGEIVPLIDELIDECQDAILDGQDEKWTADAARDEKTLAMLDKVIQRMGAVVGMVFKSKRWIKAEERFDILHLCCALFEAAEDLVKSAAAGASDFLEYDQELESLLEEAICKCDDQPMDEYLDVDYENEEEENDYEDDDEE